METKLREIGNSKGVILPKEILDKLNLGKDGRLFLVPTRDGVELRAFDPEFQKQMNIADEFMGEYGDVLRALADK
ncbi:MAG: AbrB/MazE/SpoVT family DNA-binding domain-containing protein [Proteobacteria bacterium]|nr:AbrB/MazE/SpoVT family DNA-binding domain-containing protein [Pseudomonadota bacterium]